MSALWETELGAGVLVAGGRARPLAPRRPVPVVAVGGRRTGRDPLLVALARVWPGAAAWVLRVLAGAGFVWGRPVDQGTAAEGWWLAAVGLAAAVRAALARDPRFRAGAGVRVTASGCLGRCRDGPICWVEPAGTLRAHVEPTTLDELLTTSMVREGPA